MELRRGIISYQGLSPVPVSGRHSWSFRIQRDHYSGSIFRTLD